MSTVLYWSTGPTHCCYVFVTYWDDLKIPKTLQENLLLRKSLEHYNLEAVLVTSRDHPLKKPKSSEIDCCAQVSLQNGTRGPGQQCSLQ